MKRHIPVLLTESIRALQLTPESIVVDGTLGDGGHSEAILAATAPNGKLIGIDTDPESILRAKQFLHADSARVVCIRDNFVHIKRILADVGVTHVNAILLDLGWSTPQFADRGRGFSFEADEPLDMRLSGESEAEKQTAAEFLAASTESDLEELLYRYGEEPYAKQIAAAIVVQRSTKAYERTVDLVSTILGVYRKELHSEKEIPWIGGIHPATKTFQAIRIAVNDELRVLEQVIPDAIDVLAPGGRLAIISFHSLEDRIVKHTFKKLEKEHGTIITKKPIVPSKIETKKNPRSSSAKLRVFQKK